MSPFEKFAREQGHRVIKKGPVVLVSTENMTRDQWLRFRDFGLGGSDMGTILGYNKYMSATELFYQKIGLHNSSVEENAQMFWGTELEDSVRDKGQYLNLDDQTYIVNKRDGRKLRNISRFKYMIWNENYPWLIANIDGMINLSARWMKADGIAECKCISRQSAEMWDTIPVYHLFQTNCYLTVAEPLLRELYSIIFYLQDGNKFSGWKIPIVPHLRDEMLAKSKDFWERVEKGRAIVAKEHNIDKLLELLSSIEPPADDSEKYYEFLSELYKKKQSFITVVGTEEVHKAAIKYKELGENIKDLDSKRQFQKNIIMKSLRDTGANIIQLPDGKITLNKKLYVNVGTDEEEF